MMDIGRIRDIINGRLRDGRGRAEMVASDGATGNCVYRTEAGLPCAVGALIPDEHYRPSMEGGVVSYLEVRPSMGVGGTVHRTWHEGHRGRVEDRALADVLALSGVPATEEVHLLLVRAQSLHDNHNNWDGNEYIGPDL